MFKVSSSLFALCIFTTSFSQTVKAVALADSLIHAGTFKIAVTTYTFPTEIKKLQEKALSNLKSNIEWSDKYVIKLVEEGDKDLRFMDAYGLSKEEFTTMLKGFKRGMYAVLSDTNIINIKKQNGIISFNSTGKFSLFKYLKINTISHTISFDNLTLKKEVKINGKFYAPILNGFEAFSSTGTVSPGLQKKISFFALSVGVNNQDTRTCLSLGYGTNSSQFTSPEFLIITIF